MVKADWILRPWIAPVVAGVGLVATSFLWYGLVEENRGTAAVHSKVALHQVQAQLEAQFDLTIASLENLATRWNGAAARPRASWRAMARSHVESSLAASSVYWLDPALEVRWHFPAKDGPAGRSVVPRLVLPPEAISRARDLRRPVFAHPAVESSEQPELVAIVPLSRDGVDEGFLVSCITLADVLATQDDRSSFGGYAVTIRHDDLQLNHGHGVAAGVMHVVKGTVAIGGHMWQLELAPTAELLYGMRSRLPDFALLSGLIGTGLMFLLIRIGQAAVTREKDVNAVRDQLSHAIESIDRGFALFGRNGRLVKFNQAYKSFHQPIGHLIVPGVHYRTLLEAAASAGIYADAVGRESDWIAERLDERRDPGGATERLLADGRCMRVVKRRTKDGGVVSTFTDITEQLEREQRQLQAQQQAERHLNDLSAVTNAIDYGIIIYDSDLRLRHINRAAINLWGWPDAFLAGRPSFAEMTEYNRSNGVYDIADEDWDWYLKERADAVRQGDIPPTEIYRRDGKVLIYRCKALPDGNRVLSYYDITQQKASEQELARSKFELEMRLDELVELERRHEQQAAEAVHMAEELSETKAQLYDAVSSISEGFALWDEHDRLIMCNERYRRTYPPIADMIQPGLTFADFVRSAIRYGVFPLADGEDPESQVQQRVERHRSPSSAFEQKLGDGRWLRVSKQRTKSGRVVGILTDISERRESAAIIERMALHDALTQLPNRTQFQNKLTDAIVHADRTGEYVGLMLLDIDHFKDVNDTLGHPSGDALLQQVASRVLECARATDTVARLGGDEFGVIVTHLKQPEMVMRMADRIVQSMAEPFALGNKEVHSGTSVGITLYPLDRGDPDQLLRNADLALYRAKAEGRGKCQLYDQQMHTEVQARRELENDLRRALANDEFKLVYQPQIDIVSGRLIGAEALLRWTHPERGPISPATFIPIAEASGLIIPISEWVLAEATAQNKAWQDAGMSPICVAINMSPLHFKQPDLISQVEACLRSAGLDPAWLEIEITEGMAMAAGEEIINILDRLKALGVKLSIDDFGSGYSSLERLKRFPVDRLKIDQSFVRDILADRNDAAISAAVIKLGHSLQVKVIAEGVEDADTLRFLVENECDEVQGYYFSRPLPPEELVAFAAAHDADALRDTFADWTRTPLLTATALSGAA